jgi:hypothetical protein
VLAGGRTDLTQETVHHWNGNVRATEIDAHAYSSGIASPAAWWVRSGRATR